MTNEDWEKSFTLAVVQNLAALRELQDLTIDQFAKRCDEVVGVEGRFKPNTLQALFAGKRRGVTAAELVVFAEALDVPMLALLVPVMTKHRSTMPLPRGEVPATTMWELMNGFRRTTDSSLEAKEVFQGMHLIDEFMHGTADLRNLLFTYRYLDETYGGNVKVVTSREALIEQIRGLLRSCRRSLDYLEAFGITVNEDDPVIAWCRSTLPDYLSEESLLAGSRSLWGHLLPGE